MRPKPEPGMSIFVAGFAFTPRLAAHRKLLTAGGRVNGKNHLLPDVSRADLLRDEGGDVRACSGVTAAAERTGCGAR